MRIVIFWTDFMHYHVARIQGATHLANRCGHEVFPIALRPGSPDLPVAGYHALLNGRGRVLVDSPQLGHIQSPHAARQMIAALQEIGPDAVAIAGYDNRVALAALGWCRRHRRGAILMSESKRSDFARHPWKEWSKRGLLTAFDAALVGGKAQMAYAIELGIPSARVFTGYDVVDNDFWAAWADRARQEAPRWRAQLNLPEHFFLTACRLVPKKNVAGLLRAYARYAAQEAVPWSLVIAGDGPLRAELESLAQSLGVARQVHFLGYLSADQMGPVYGLASAFVLASTYSEQWGLVVNEAMAAGLPVLVSQICGCVPDLVVPGVTGYAFDPADEPALAQLLARCSRGEIDLAQLGRASQKHMQAYSPQTFAKNLIAAAEAAVSHAQKRRLNVWPLPLVLP